MHPACGRSLSAPEKGNRILPICSPCLQARETGVSVSTMREVVQNVVLSDENINRASMMLAAQFGNEIHGFQTPLLVERGKRIDQLHNYYKPVSAGTDYVQIFHTGLHHWVTGIYQKGTSEVTVLDSCRRGPLSGHLKHQVAVIAKAKESVIIKRVPCKQQTNAVDCGLFAIANATEYCHSRRIEYVDYDADQLRPHWLQCLESGILSPFPRRAQRPKKVKEDDDVISFKVYCVCRLPDTYSNLIECEKCEEWFHHSCSGLDETYKGSFICDKCI